MKKILDVIQTIENNWLKPASTPKTSEPFRLVCSIQKREEEFINPFSFQLPDDLVAWWRAVETALLFEDIDFGQWGLQIFSETEALNMSEECRELDSDYKNTDIVIGAFLGDADLLVISVDEKCFGQIIIGLPIDRRPDWYVVANSLNEFLNIYIEKEGDKFWEKQ
jgi:hypothetical protein